MNTITCLSILAKERDAVFLRKLPPNGSSFPRWCFLLLVTSRGDLVFREYMDSKELSVPVVGRPLACESLYIKGWSRISLKTLERRNFVRG